MYYVTVWTENASQPLFEKEFDNLPRVFQWVMNVFGEDGIKMEITKEEGSRFEANLIYPSKIGFQLWIAEEK